MNAVKFEIQHLFAGDETTTCHRFSLLGDPDILVFDEPTNGLDPAGIAEIRELIKDLYKSRENHHHGQPYTG